MSDCRRIPCECWEIIPPAGLDPIHAFWLDIKDGAGYVTLICYGQAWTAYFGAMSGRTIREFFGCCDVSYLVGKMGITPALKQSKKNAHYLGRIVRAVQDAIAVERLGERPQRPDVETESRVAIEEESQEPCPDELDGYFGAR